MSGMTLRVYTVDTSTGQRTDLPTVDPSPVAFPGQSHNFPPCLCPRCLPCAADIVQDGIPRLTGPASGP